MRHLVLVPGLICDEALWGHQTEHLSALADITVADATRQESIGAMAEALLAAAPKEFALAGLSMGGYVCLEVMRRSPGRVTRLALLDTSARPDTEEQTRVRHRLMRLAGEGGFEQVISALLPLIVHPDRVRDERLGEDMRQMNRRVGTDAFRRQQTAIIGRPDSRKDLSEIPCPTLVLCGRQDGVTPLEVHEEMCSLIPGARLAVIEDCGHMSTMERPQAVTALLRDWLLYR
jgi:pimeloyl-ACP methyl ester carboxylesterase